MNSNENKNGKILSFIVSVVICVGVSIWFGYQRNFFSFMGINVAGINGCYYQENEKDALCFEDKKAYFKSNPSKKYYVEFNSSLKNARVEDEYGNEIATCKRVKDSSNIICGTRELHKK